MIISRQVAGRKMRKQEAWVERYDSKGNRLEDACKLRDLDDKASKATQDGKSYYIMQRAGGVDHFE